MLCDGDAEKAAKSIGRERKKERKKERKIERGLLLPG
jgi:hypothetical protein